MKSLIHTLLAAGAASLGLATLVASAGCEAFGYAVQSIDSESDVEFVAKYDGLNGKRIAVLVDAPLDTQYEHRTVVPALCDYISAGLKEIADGARILPPNYAVAYQANNINWPSMDLGDLARVLGVERLVIVDLVEYRLNAPGNSYLWDGVLVADINIFEADGADPTTPVFSERVKARYPSVDGKRREDAPAATIEQGLQIKFAQDTVNLFRTYTRKKGDIQADTRKERHRL